MSSDDLDPVIHVQARLRVMVSLAALAPDDLITFPRLRDLLEMTAGNLSIHLRKLEEAGYIVISKTFARRTPVTQVALTPDGRKAFDNYVATLRALLPDTEPQPTEGTAS